MMRAAAGVGLLLALGACAPAVRDGAPGPDADIRSAMAQRYPASQSRLATTDESIYLGNLDARMESLRADSARANTAATHGALANALLQRFRILGKIEDAEAALQETELAMAGDGAQPDAWILRASALSVFHRFAEARVALDRAQREGAAGALLARVHRDLDVAEGNYRNLAEELQHSAEPVADFYELAHRADLRVLLNDLSGATRLYQAAQDQFVDTSPAQLSWLYVQQGIALLRFSEIEAARRFFAAAHERMPHYALATEHLAECEYRLGHLDAARRLYRQVIDQTGNPEYVAALALVERAAGNETAADGLDASAEAGYRNLLDRHRGGYAQHFAEFLLQRAASGEALALARENVALRSDIGSLILLAQAADAAGDIALACQARNRAIATGVHPPELSRIELLAPRCAD